MKRFEQKYKQLWTCLKDKIGHASKNIQELKSQKCEKRTQLDLTLIRLAKVITILQAEQNHVLDFCNRIHQETLFYYIRSEATRTKYAHQKFQAMYEYLGNTRNGTYSDPMFNDEDNYPWTGNGEGSETSTVVGTYQKFDLGSLDSNITNYPMTGIDVESSEAHSGHFIEESDSDSVVYDND